MTSDDPGFDVDPEVDTFNEAAIEELIDEASSELQLLLKGVSLTVSQVLREMTRVLSESADLLMLISSDLLKSSTLLQFQDLYKSEYLICWPYRMKL